MALNKTYWKSIDQINSSNEDLKKLEHNEFVSKLPEDFLSDEETLEKSNTSRRDFLKYAGFTTAVATIAACEGPVINSVPYVFQPEQIRPGIANYYATTMADGYDFASILIKTREGRPIKIESNPDAPTLGSANARVHASVLSLYDNMRLKGPLAFGKEVSWENLCVQVENRIKAMAKVNKNVVLLTPTIPSPTTKKIISRFNKLFPNIRHVIHDPISSDSALNAFETFYGQRALADYDFSKSKIIVSIGANFLEDWQGGGYESGYAKSRIPLKKNKKASMSKHFQFESNMSLTGANADYRLPCTPSDQKNILAYIYDNLILGLPGQLSEKLKPLADKALGELKN